MKDMISQGQGKITDNYEVSSKLIGRGAFAEVYQAIQISTGMVRAVKIIDKENMHKEIREELSNEIDILSKLDHPNIIKIFEFFEDKHYFYIIMELCQGGELFERI